MKILVCNTCGHIEFNQAPEICLVCRAPGSAFTENAEAIKSPADPANLTDGDKKHIPLVTVTKHDAGAEAAVVVGDIVHVMEAKHFIQWLDFYHDHKFISRIWLSPETMTPCVKIMLTVQSGTLTVVENCNVHGNWMAEAAI